MRVRRLTIVGTWLASGFVMTSSVSLAHCGDEEAAAEPPISIPERREETDGDVEADAPLVECDREKPFGAPVPVPGLDPNVFAATPRLAADELTIYFTTLTLEDGALIAELVRATRASRDVAFGPLAPLSKFNTPAHDNDPMVASDNLSLWFSSSRSGDNELYVATRASITGEFGPATLVPNVNSASSQEMHPYYRASGPELWLTSDRSDAGFDIYLATQKDGSFQTPVHVPELASAALDVQPALTEDGLVVVLASNRDGGAGGFDLWVARRASVTASFEAPKPVAEINGTADEYAGWFSPDGCRLYFSSNREADGGITHRIYYAERSR